MINGLERLERFIRETLTYPNFSTSYNVDMWIEDKEWLKFSLSSLDVFSKAIKIKNTKEVFDAENCSIRHFIELESERLDDEYRKILTQWVIENIDKKTIKEWLKGLENASNND